jgi:hypothetical protein
MIPAEICRAALAEAGHPDLAAEIGTNRAGHPMRCLDAHDETSARLARTADAYRRADPRRPTAATAEAMGITKSAAAKRIARARQADLLPPTSQGRRRQCAGPHQPLTARWCDASESWLACQFCRAPWPCASSQEPT